MKRLFVSAAIGAFVCAASGAEARRGGSATDQDLVFVTEVDLADANGKPLSLCVLTETQSLVFINFFRSAESYALATERCAVEQFFPLDADGVAAGRADGWFPEAAPVVPELSWGQWVFGHWGMIGAGLLVLGGVASGFPGSGRHPGRPANPAMDSFSERAITVMAMAAGADAPLEQQDIGAMQMALEHITGINYPADEIVSRLPAQENAPWDDAYAALARGMNANERELLVKAALIVAARDGDISSEQGQCLSKVARAMGIDHNRLDAIVDATFGDQRVPRRDGPGTIGEFLPMT